MGPSAEGPRGLGGAPPQGEGVGTWGGQGEGAGREGGSAGRGGQAGVPSVGWGSARVGKRACPGGAHAHTQSHRPEATEACWQWVLKKCYHQPAPV